MMLQFMMMLQHTKFGNERFSSSEHIIQTFSDILNLHCDLDLEHSNPVFSQDTQTYNDVPST